MSQAPTVVHAAKFASDGGERRKENDTRNTPRGNTSKRKEEDQMHQTGREEREWRHRDVLHGKEGKADGEEGDHRTPPIGR